MIATKSLGLASMSAMIPSPLSGRASRNRILNMDQCACGVNQKMDQSALFRRAVDKSVVPRDIPVMPAPGFTVVTAEILDEFCARVHSGRTIRDVGRDPDMPSYSAIYEAMHREEAVANALARARRESAHGLAESVVDIADSCTDPAQAQITRNRCEQRRWLAGKLHTQYADKGQEVNVTLNLATLIEAARAGPAASMAEAPSVELPGKDK